jgi:hypothetical protein
VLNAASPGPGPVASLFWRMRRATSIDVGLLRRQSEILRGSAKLPSQDHRNGTSLCRRSSADKARAFLNGFVSQTTAFRMFRRPGPNLRNEANCGPHGLSRGLPRGQIRLS